MIQGHIFQFFGTGERFSTVVEERISEGLGPFQDPHPFLNTALRGLVGRLSEERFPPVGLALATDRYTWDMSNGVDSYTGGSMPVEVTGLPVEILGGIFRSVVFSVAGDAFCEGFRGELTRVINYRYNYGCTQLILPL